MNTLLYGSYSIEKERILNCWHEKKRNFLENKLHNFENYMLRNLMDI